MDILYNVRKEIKDVLIFKKNTVIINQARKEFQLWKKRLIDPQSTRILGVLQKLKVDYYIWYRGSPGQLVGDRPDRKCRQVM
jgi:hypothetical protein